MLIPAGWTIAHDYVAEHGGAFHLAAQIYSSNPRLSDRLEIKLSINDEPVDAAAEQLGIFTSITLAAGHRLGLSAKATGDGRPVPVKYRYRLSDEARCENAAF